MDRGVFQDATTAGRLNEGCVSVKIDRWERPELDRLFQRWATASGHRPSWPLNIWLTPDGQPLRLAVSMTLADDGQGSFREEIRHFLDLWAAEASHLTAEARNTGMSLVRPPETRVAGPLEIDETLLARAQSRMLGEFDPLHGGFGQTPKFPSPARLGFLAQRAAREPVSATRTGEALAAVRRTLERLAASGLRDHVGGGFFRYALDEAWRRPSFEKLALDQAFQAEVFLLGHRLTGEEWCAVVAGETLGYAVAELGHPLGGFYNGEHAESLAPCGEFREGAYYLWEHAELEARAGGAAEAVALLFDMQPRGNLPPGLDPRREHSGMNLPVRRVGLAEVADQLGLPVEVVDRQLAQGRSALRAARQTRKRPAIDRLVVTQPNAALVSALCRAGVQLNEPAWLDRARRGASFIRSQLWDASSGTLHRCRLDRAPARVAGAEDHAILVRALLDLHQSTGEIEWLQWGAEVQAAFDKHHADPTGGGYFDARHGHSDAPVALKSIDDADGFSANAVAGQNLVRWAVLLQNPGRAEEARRLLGASASSLQAGSGEVAGLFQVVESLVRPPRRIILFGPAEAPEVRSARRCLALASLGSWEVLCVENPTALAWLREQRALPPAVGGRSPDRPVFYVDGAPGDAYGPHPLQELHNFLARPR